MKHVGIKQAREALPELVHQAESVLLAVREPCISTLTEVEFASLIARM